MKTGKTKAWFTCVFLATCIAGLPTGFSQIEKGQDEKVSDSEQEKTDSKEATNPTRAIGALRIDLLDYVAALTKRYNAANAEERKEIIGERRDMEKEIVLQVITLTRERDRANRNIKDLTYFFGKTKGVARQAARKELMDKYIDSPDMVNFSKALASHPKLSADTELWIGELAEKSSNAKVQANAKLAMAKYLERVIEEVANTDEEDLTDYLAEKAKDDNLDAQLEDLLNQCVEDHADITRVAGAAKQMLGMMNLKVGKIAPDIVGLDLDDQEFKLSDYRGKVVVVDFWGDW